MKQNTRKLIASALVLATLAPQGAFAAYDDVGIGARVSGFGGAYTAVADDAYALYYNPAGLATLARPELATSYSKLLSGLSDGSNVQDSFLAYAHPLDAGRLGTVGAAWNYFTLDSLYRESSFYGSYGHELFAQQLPGRLYGGVSLKALSRGLGAVSQASQPLGPTGQVQLGAVDPVLQRSSKTNFDADLGLLYRVQPRWTLGATVLHLLQPNIAFSSSDTDTLGRNYRLGGAYRTPFSTLSADLDFLKAPDGSTDKIAAVAAEKWLPTLVHGTFGVRGGLAVGSRSYRQLSMGVSYKIHRMEFDYGFAMPLGGIAGTFGTHRLGITLRFGRLPQAMQPTMGEAVLENMRDLAQVGTPQFRYQMEDLALFKRTAIEEFLRQAKLDVGAGRFADALDKLHQAESLKPRDAALTASQDRLKVVADVYPQVGDFASDPAQAALYEGAVDYLIGHDRDALKKLAYAQTLNPKDEKLETLMEAVESKSGLSRAPVPSPSVAPTLGAEKVVGGAMALMEVALQEREYDKVLKLAEQVVELDPSNALAYKRMGAADYALGKYPDALKALRSAYKLEADSEQRKTLRSYIEALTSLMKKRSRAAERRAVEPEKPASRSPQEIERLYEAGVDLYAQGRLPEAATTFQKILQLDASNVSARRALDRVQAEILQNEKR